MYTTPTCGYCSQVKQYLAQREVAYREINVAADPQAAAEMVRVSGQRGVPVVVMDGQVVIGFNPARIDQLLSARGAKGPHLGVSVADAKRMAQKLGSGATEGAYVGKVRPLSAGDRAGLVVGDVIVALAGHPVADAQQLEATLASLVPGEAVSLVYIRGGERITARVTP